jgi:phosphonate transport system substrate-binding protein
MKAFIIGILAIIVLAFAGCKNKGSVDSNGIPKTLIIAAVQSESQSQVKMVRESVRKYLEKKLGMPVEMIFTTDYDGVIEALKSNKVHMAYIPPFAYVIATRTMHLTPIVTLGNNGKPSTYHSVIIVSRNSKIKSMADVKANAKDLTLCFVDPASTSGHLIPRAYLNSIGLNPDTAFKQTIFAGSHPASVLAVKSGKIDVGCTTDMGFDMMIKAGMLKEGDVKILWVSEPIIGDPIVVRSDVNKDFAKKIQKAYLDMSKEAPEILRNYVKLYMHDTAKRSYMIAQDSSYNGLRRIAAGIKGLKAN